jgi:hypothetical protein
MAAAANETSPLPLSALLSQVLVAFTIECDNEFERQMPHRTSNYGSTAGRAAGPWLVSMAMWWTCMRLVRRPLTGAIEARWAARFGADTIAGLRESLQAIAAQLDPALPDCLPILGYGRFSAPGDGPRPDPAATAGPRPRAGHVHALRRQQHHLRAPPGTTDPLSRRTIGTRRRPLSSSISRTRSRSVTGPVWADQHPERKHPAGRTCHPALGTRCQRPGLASGHGVLAADHRRE